jgi:mannosyltransferase
MQTLEKRKQKITKWVKNPHNATLLLILILATALRLYYFNLVGNQPVWWDEGEYMSMARAISLNLNYEFLPVRPLLLSIITAFFFKIAPTEFLPRILLLILSLASIFGIYLLGKEMYGKKVGLIAAILMSASYLNLFYAFRLLVDLPSLTFFTFSAYFFYKYFKTNSHKMLYFGAITIAIGTLFRITTATFLFAMVIYVLATQKLKFIKKKEIWISAIIFILILSPYIIWGFIQFNGFVITMAGAHNAPAEGTMIPNGLFNLKSYIKMLPNIFSWPTLILFITGLFLMYNLFLGLDILLFGKEQKLNKDLFLLLLFLLPIISVSFSLGNHYSEDRYMINSLPAVYIIAASASIKIYSMIKKNSKPLAILFLVLFLVLATYPQLKYADNLIKYKKDSFGEFKTSGIWLKENTEPYEKVASSSWPMTGYYSERGTHPPPVTEEEFEEYRLEHPDLNYFIISATQGSPQWTYDYPQRKNLTAINAYFADQEQQQPILIIYKLD